MKLRFLRRSEAACTLFSRFQWFRRLAGGKWERWWVDSPVNAPVWHDVKHFTREWRLAAERMQYQSPMNSENMNITWWGFRPTPLCRGTPLEENWN